MRTAKKLVCALMMAAMLLVMLSTSVFATESGNVWLNVTETAEGNTQISIVADEAVSDAYVELTFDSASLNYITMDTDPNYVGVYSVNADESGKVKIAWVSEGNYSVAEEGTVLLTITFTGVTTQLPTLSGSLNDASGNALTIAETVKEEVDKTELTKAVLAAQGLKTENYTSESFSAVETALNAALIVLENDLATRRDVEEATVVLNDAMDALVLVAGSGDADVNKDELTKLILKAEGLQKIMYSAESFTAMETALTAGKEVVANEEATQEQVDAAALALREAIDALVLISGDAPDTGAKNVAMPMLLLAIVSGAGLIAVAVVFISKKGRCAK